MGENAAHIIGCRAGWFTFVLGEGNDEIKAIAEWDAQDAPARTGQELARALDLTWDMMAACLARWNDEDMQKTFQDDWDGEIVHLSRAWIVYHVMEHDLHHGGELSFTLGMHGIKTDFPG